MKSKLIWVVICAVCLGVSLAITHVFHVAGIYKWTSIGVAAFVFIGILALWERKG